MRQSRHQIGFEEAVPAHSSGRAGGLAMEKSKSSDSLNVRAEETPVRRSVRPRWGGRKSRDAGRTHPGNLPTAKPEDKY